jgi:hypothetical protein
MSRSPWQFRPTAIKRLVKTAHALELTVTGIEVGKDLIRVLVADPDAPLLASGSAANAAMDAHCKPVVA